MELVEPLTWNPFVDGSSGEISYGVGVLLFNPEEHMLDYDLRFRFKATNNATNYEAFLASLGLAKKI